MKVTIEFDSADEAIVALGAVCKLAGASVGKRSDASPDSRGTTPAAASTTAPSSADASATRAPRKPRSDAGQARGPYTKPAPQNAAGASAAPVPGVVSGGSGSTAAVAAGNSTSGTTDPSSTAKESAGASTSTTPPAPKEAAQPGASATTAPAAPITNDTVQAALEKLFNKLDYVGSIAVLQRFGVRRGPDLPQGQRAEFLRRVEDICAGKYAGTDAWPA